MLFLQSRTDRWGPLPPPQIPGPVATAGVKLVASQSGPKWRYCLCADLLGPPFLELGHHHVGKPQRPVCGSLWRGTRREAFTGLSSSGQPVPPWPALYCAILEGGPLASSPAAPAHAHWDRDSLLGEPCPKDRSLS